MEAAFFDLDKTVIATASMVAFGRPFYREGLISRRTVLRSVYGQLVYMHLGASEEKLARIRESVLALTKGWDQARIRAIVAETLEEIVEPIIYGEALDLIEAHRQMGRLVYIVSASPDEIVAPLARHLGADGAIASRPRIDGHGRYTGEMDFYAYGPFKAEAIKELAALEDIDLEGSFAYSDSYTDLPMLEVVGHAVAVNPDRLLANAARDRGWEVRQFERRVKLDRSRRAVANPARAAAWAGIGLAGAGAAVMVGWRLEVGRRAQLAAR
ncbi:MAG: HAD family hydrolase [Acidimicrobiales bacterium]